MPDLIYISNRLPKGELLADLQTQTGLESVRRDGTEFNGTWGTLATLSNHYHGLQWYEDEERLAVVQGGPLVFLSDIAAELPRHSDCRGTAAIVRAWKVTRTLDWTSDVSGPFVVFLVDKRRGLVEVVTDMMGLLPVYYAGLASPDKGVVVGTHLDLVAAVAGRSAQFDCASVAEFVERGEVT